MASDATFVQHVVEQLALAGHITFRRMFGEYAIYCDTKVIGLVVDNQFYLKPTDVGKSMMEHRPVEVAPFPGAKNWLLIDDELENNVWISRLVRATADTLPLPMPKKPRAASKKAAAKKAVTKKVAAKKAAKPAPSRTNARQGGTAAAKRRAAAGSR